MTNKEQWKFVDIKLLDIPGGKYIISNKGNIKRIRANEYKDDDMNTSLRSGYRSVWIETKWHKIHRLVAYSFIPNGDPLRNVVNHIDGNKLNNTVENLEWVTAQENNIHAMKHGLAKVTERGVSQYDKSGNLIKTFKSILDASKMLKIDDGSIVKTCKGRQHTAGGFVWKYTNPNPNLDQKPDLSQYIEIKKYGDHMVRKGYFVNKEGKIYSAYSKMFLKHSIQRDGLEYVYLSDGKKDFQCLIHRLVAIHFANGCGNNPIEITHIDGNKLNNNIANLKVHGGGNIVVKKI